MRKYLGNVIAVIVVLAGIVLGFCGGVTLSALQLKTLVVLGIVAGCSALYCFAAGEITGNTSQMDKLWSLLPIAYLWIVAIRGGLHLRLVIMAVLVTLWGIRLTYNFGLKGAYTLKFWSGREDYRWQVLRQSKYLKNRFVWALFDLLFISVYQNALVLAICLPALACMDSAVSFGAVDGIAAALVLGFLVLETTADRQQWNFHNEKNRLLGEGKTLEQLPEPYCRGFNTTGVWAYSRHPNYFSEQAVWICLYLFCIGAGVTHWGVFHWSIAGCLLLVLLFMGSSAFGESVSNGKYPQYARYRQTVSKYVPWKKYEP